MLGKILFAVIALGGVAVAAAPKKSTKGGAPPPAPPAPNASKLGGYDFGEFYLNGAKPEGKLLTIVLLHAEDSDAAKALAVLSTLKQPARVVVPRGNVVTPNGRAYLPLAAQGEALTKAVSTEAWALQGVLTETMARFAVADRLVVIGLGTAGAMATLLGLEGGAWVRLAYGVGGTVTAGQVPLAQEPHAVAVRKLSYGDAVGFDKLAAATAAERGINYFTLYEADVDPVGGVLDDATTRAWLMPLLEQDLGGA